MKGTSSASALPRSSSSRRLRRISMMLSALILAILLIPVGMGVLSMWMVTHPLCAHGRSPEDFGLTAEDVLVPSRLGVDYPGYFFSGTNGATIIVPPAYGQDRGGLLHEVAVLVRGGYSVLTFDSRPCGGIAPHSLGIWEAEDVVDALDYLRLRGDVDMTRVGAHGFSQAGASNLFAAARSDEIRAVVAEGGYVDYGPQTLGIGRAQDAFSTLFGLGALLGYRASTGLDMHGLKPLDLIPAIAPRQILLVYGSFEVTLAGARQAAALGDHVQLWEVPGATHGSYLWSAGETAFGEHVVGFFDTALASVSN